ncbi:E3 ubiquitin-protein ligase RNF181-like isoform X3 [Lolium rigidum]|uniref:E3 ubiquitin-protein ligase RNF181-like isoform X3 n=1 Tax=Lolium rigidum TaxID=89674 RepID=UPI001F5C48CD|nr:E3 ubiquitin-protein ligase RNF181-like isoform X3 [Lolium rigidum]
MPIALPLRPTPSPWTTAHFLEAVAEHTDSDDDIGYDTDDTDYDDDEYEQHRLPASRAAVESLPEAALDEEEAACGCAVCKDVFAPGQRVVRLPCKHYFHGDCIWPWLAIRSTCPMCRYQLPTDDAESRRAPQLGALVPVARHGEAQQSGDRDGGDGSGASIGGGDIDVARGHGNT